jgi:hypothetical protein
MVRQTQNYTCSGPNVVFSSGMVGATAEKNQMTGTESEVTISKKDFTKLGCGIM